MSKLGPYASYDKETGYATWDHPTAVYTGIFERLNLDVKGIIHVGLYDFPEHDCYTKLVGTRVVGVEANKFVYDTMAKPVADECGYLCFNECLYSEDGLKKQFFLANDCSTLNPVAYSAHLSAKLSRGSYVDVTTKKLSTLIEENNIDSPLTEVFHSLSAWGGSVKKLPPHYTLLSCIICVNVNNIVG